jgi:hypothetical protein
VRGTRQQTCLVRSVQVACLEGDQLAEFAPAFGGIVIFATSAMLLASNRRLSNKRPYWLILGLAVTLWLVGLLILIVT